MLDTFVSRSVAPSKPSLADVPKQADRQMADMGFPVVELRGTRRWLPLGTIVILSGD